MNYTTINPVEYTNRVNALRKQMEKDGMDLVVGFSNLSEVIIFCSCRNGSAVLTGTITTLSYVAPFDIWTFFHPFKNRFPLKILK